MNQGPFYSFQQCQCSVGTVLEPVPSGLRELICRMWFCWQTGWHAGVASMPPRCLSAACLDVVSEHPLRATIFQQTHDSFANAPQVSLALLTSWTVYEAVSMPSPSQGFRHGGPIVAPSRDGRFFCRRFPRPAIARRVCIDRFDRVERT